MMGQGKLGSIFQHICLCIAACWVLLTFSGLVTLLVTGKMFANKIGPKVVITDFVNVYNAGLLTRECVTGHHLQIYDPKVQAESEDRVIAPWKPEAPFYLQYPPYFFALMLPLSVTSLSGAYVIWSLAGLAGLLFCLFYVLNQTSFGGKDKALAILSVLLAYPTWLSFGMGQTSLLNFTFITSTFLFLQRKKPLLAGLACSLVAIKLQYAPAIFLVGLLAGRVRFLAGFAVGFAALVLYSAATLGVDNLMAWPKALLMGETSKNVSGVSPVSMQCLRGYLTLILPHADAKIVAALSALGFLAGLAGIAWLWWQYSKSEQTEERFKFVTAITFPLLMITSMHTHVYDYVMMAVPGLWLWDLSRKYDCKESKLIRCLVAAYPLASWISAKFRDFFFSIFISFDLFWGVLLLILAFRLYYKSQKAPPSL